MVVNSIMPPNQVSLFLIQESADIVFAGRNTEHRSDAVLGDWLLKMRNGNAHGME